VPSKTPWGFCDPDHTPISETPAWRVAHGLHPREGESPLRLPADLTPDEVEQAFASARAGCSVRALAKAFRVTRAAAHGLCQWARVLPLEADMAPHPECPPAFEREPESAAEVHAGTAAAVEAPTPEAHPTDAPAAPADATHGLTGRALEIFKSLGVPQ